MWNIRRFTVNDWMYDFKEMMAYYKGNKYPLRYDSQGDIVDFFDYTGDQYWIDCGERVLVAYKDWIAESALIA